MHNSMVIRELLERTNNDPLYTIRRDPHRLVMRDPTATQGEGEITLNPDWRVESTNLTPDVAALLEDDLHDYVARMGTPTPDNVKETAGTIRLSMADDLAPRDVRLVITPELVRVEGGDVAGLWAAHAWLEREMGQRRGPFLPLGTIYRPAAWDVQVSQGPWGGNYSVPDFSPTYLSDDSFRLYAHYGVNHMMIYGDLLCYVRSEILPELNHPDYDHHIAMLQDAAQRAARYGVQFSYLVVGPKLRTAHPLFQRRPQTRGSGLDRGAGMVHCLCSSEPLVRDFYHETFTRLFTAVPELGGVNLIIGGESFYHCRMWSRAQEKCPCCYARRTRDVIGELVGTVREAVQGAQPAAFVSAWAYNPSGFEPGERLELIRQLPKGVDWFHQIEKDQLYVKDGYTKHVWDYSVDYAGPSDSMREIAQVTRESGRGLFVKTETGIGLEVFQYPYVPAMQRLATKWEGVRSLEPKGVQQSWLFFGMFGSRAEELALWAATGGDIAQEDLLRQMARRDFGPTTVETVLSAWQSMSAAMGHIPCVTLLYYYIGPSLGPCHPLLPNRDSEVPEVFHGYLYYLQEGEETFSHRQVDEAKTCLALTELPDDASSLRISWPGASDGWEIAIREYAAAAAYAEDAWRKLEAASALTATAADAERLAEERLLAELVWRTFLACEHTLRFLRARREREEADLTDPADPALSVKAFAEMLRIADAERANALGALPIYQQAPWLDIANRTDGTYHSCIEMIETKVAMLDQILAEG